MVCATTQAPLYIGEGFGAPAQQQNCLTNCKRNCAKQGLSTAPDGSCVTSYPDCQTAYSNDPRLTNPCPSTSSSDGSYGNVSWEDHIESLKCLLAEENSTMAGYSKTDLANEGYSCSALTKVWIDVEDAEAGDDAPAYDQYTETYATEQMCYKCTCACPNEVMEEDADGNFVTKIVCARYSSCSDWNANAVDTKPTNYTWTQHTVDGLCSGNTCYLKGEYCSGGRSVSSDGKSCVCPSSTPLWDNTNSRCRKACPKDVSYCSAYDSLYDDCNCSACQSGYNLQLNVNTGKYSCQLEETCAKDVENCLAYDNDEASCKCTVCSFNFVPNSDGSACVCPSKYEDLVNGKCEDVYSSCHAAGYMTHKEAWEMDGTYGSSTPQGDSFYIGKNGSYSLQTCYMTAPLCTSMCVESGTGYWIPSKGQYCDSTAGTCGKVFETCQDAGLMDDNGYSYYISLVDYTGHDLSCVPDVAPCMNAYDRRECMESCFDQYKGYGGKLGDEDYMYPLDVCSIQCQDCSGANASNGLYVVLTNIGSSKIKVIRAIQSATGLSMSNAKTAADNAPVVIGSGLTTSEAASIKKQLEAAGATVEIR